MKYIGAAVTDIGTTKKTNQDSCCIKVVDTENYGQVAMMVLCDGMGGLEKGELASATVIRAFANWFDKELPAKIINYSWKDLTAEWTRLAKEQNHLIGQFGRSVDTTLGTTLTAMLIIEDKYLIVHVGDSRAYNFNNGVTQLTEDQTFIHREIKAGRMTPEQAATDKRRNMLLQCIGASANVEPQIVRGNIEKNSVYMLCSDGFRHVISNEEMLEKFNFESLVDVQAMEINGRELIELVKSRKERDNITVTLLKCFE